MGDVRETLERLYALRSHGIKPGLDAMRLLLAKLGEPHAQLAAIHVAGTNGKGSVCAMLDSILRAAGYKTGLYTSPHLLRFNERIRVDGEMIGDSELADLFEIIEPAAAAVNRELERELTFFEISTAMAFQYFKARDVKTVVLETGMGGRLDATNVVIPLIAVITRIGIDHAQYLGGTIEAIASEKGGIVKPNRPVVCGSMPEAAMAVIRRIATERGAPFYAAEESVDIAIKAHDLTGTKVSIASTECDYGTVRLPLVGAFQVENAATVIAALHVLGGCAPFRFEPPQVKRGLEDVRWPGRLQRIGDDPPVLLDGAHNPDAAAALVAALRKIFRGRPLALVCGMCADKDNRGFLSVVGSFAKAIWTVPLRTERGMAPAELAALAAGPGRDVRVAANVPDALAAAKTWAGERGGVVCITGSLYLVGEVLESLGWGAQESGW